MKKYNTVIIGGGAAGMVAALAAFYKNKTLKTAIIEKNKTLGKKILATGNGKCNLSNENVSWENYYPYKNNFYFDILKKNEDYIKKLFDKLGILFYTDESGRIYPSSCSAKTANISATPESPNFSIPVRVPRDTITVPHGSPGVPMEQVASRMLKITIVPGAGTEP